MALRFLLRAKTTKLLLGTTALAGGTTAATMSTYDDPASVFKLCSTIAPRLFRNSLTAASIAFDYGYSLWGLPEDSAEKLKVKSEVHTRSAYKLQQLCFKNGGIYIKLGQHISQMEYLVPHEYVKIMGASMLNKCPVSSYDQVREVVRKELGGYPEEIFKEFDPVPIASASLAQVHVARTHDGQKVAVKVQHTHMTDTSALDCETVAFVVNILHRCFPSFDYRWLVDEGRESLPKELDFLNEAKNSVKCMNNFRRLSPHIADYVYAPKVNWTLSSSKLITMEFIDGAMINVLKTIQRLGVNPRDVSLLVTQTFAEMMFRHGFVHCDPHAANLIVRPMPSGKKSLFGKRKPQLVLLDHGLYKELDDSMRINYAALWKGLVLSDTKSIKENCVKLGSCDDFFPLLARMLTMRAWERVVDTSVDHLVVHGSDHSELQMYASQYFSEINALLTRIPRVILGMLKTNDCLRAVNNSMLQGSSLESFFIVGSVSSKAVIEAKFSEQLSLLSWLHAWLEKISVDSRLLAMQLALWALQIQRCLTL